MTQETEQQKYKQYVNAYCPECGERVRTIPVKGGPLKKAMQKLKAHLRNREVDVHGASFELVEEKVNGPTNRYAIELTGAENNNTSREGSE